MEGLCTVVDVITTTEIIDTRLLPCLYALVVTTEVAALQQEGSIYRIVGCSLIERCLTVGHSDKLPSHGLVNQRQVVVLVHADKLLAVADVVSVTTHLADTPVKCSTVHKETIVQEVLVLAVEHL